MDNPLNLNGSRLEVSVFIVTAKKTALTNIKSILNVLGIENIKFVLDSYATSLSVLTEQQKKFGVTVIDMGSTTTEFVIYKSNSVEYNGFLAIASNNITNDLSTMLHTPPKGAEQIKMKYGSLIKDYTPNNDLGATKIRISRLGDEETTSEIALDHIQTIIHARVEEILILVRNQLKKSGFLDNIGSGIVMTGGLSNLDGIKELAENIFEGIPISIGIPKNIENPFNVNFDEPEMSTIVGLLMYLLSTNRTYQLDSSKRLIKPIKDNDIDGAINISKPLETQQGGDNIEIKDNSTVLIPLEKKKKINIWDKIKDIF
ncbi:MAG: cell division protein FtsA [Arcobacter sp.]|nr:MAG: cell division protein FtsA [Arcobacter sp.]